LILRLLPGLAVAAAGALLGWAVHLLLPWVPWLTAALVLGVIAGSIPPLRASLDGPLGPGLAFSARTLLRAGIVVLGLKLSLLDIAGLGWGGVLAIIAVVAASFAATWAIAKALRLPGDEPMLLAAGFSICGVSAVGAMSAARRSPASDTGTPIALVTLYGTLAIVVLPALAALLGLTPVQAGQWTGLAVHDVGQVVATAGTLGAGALAVAVVVKLTRVLMLAPMVALAALGSPGPALARSRREHSPGSSSSGSPSWRCSSSRSPAEAAGERIRPPAPPEAAWSCPHRCAAVRLLHISTLAGSGGRCRLPSFRA